MDFVDLMANKDISQTAFFLLAFYYERGYCPNEQEAKIRFDVSKSAYYKAKKEILEKFSGDLFDPNYKFGGKEPLKLV